MFLYVFPSDFNFPESTAPIIPPVIILSLFSTEMFSKVNEFISTFISSYEVVYPIYPPAVPEPVRDILVYLLSLSFIVPAIAYTPPIVSSYFDTKSILETITLLDSTVPSIWPPIEPILLSDFIIDFSSVPLTVQLSNFTDVAFTWPTIPPIFLVPQSFSSL